MYFYSPSFYSSSNGLNCSILSWIWLWTFLQDRNRLAMKAMKRTMRTKTTRMERMMKTLYLVVRMALIKRNQYSLWFMQIWRSLLGSFFLLHWVLLKVRVSCSLLRRVCSAWGSQWSSRGCWIGMKNKECYFLPAQEEYLVVGESEHHGVVVELQVLQAVDGDLVGLVGGGLVTDLAVEVLEDGVLNGVVTVFAREEGEGGVCENVLDLHVEGPGVDVHPAVAVQVVIVTEVVVAVNIGCHQGVTAHIERYEPSEMDIELTHRAVGDLADPAVPLQEEQPVLVHLERVHLLVVHLPLVLPRPGLVDVDAVVVSHVELVLVAFDVVHLLQLQISSFFCRVCLTLLKLELVDHIIRHDVDVIRAIGHLRVLRNYSVQLDFRLQS